MSKILLAQDTIDGEDMKALAEWLQQAPSPQLTKGALTVQYEEAYAKIVGREFACFVNSGSSANLIQISSLIELKMLKNKKVVVPSLCWATTISPIIQLGLEPILCEINLRNLGADIEHLEEIFKAENPSALFLVSVLGMPPDMEAIEFLCEKYGVLLLMDNCESALTLHKLHHIEKYGIMSSHSSYFGHNFATAEGGIVVTDNLDLFNMLKQQRSHGWGRDLSEARRRYLKTKHSVSDFNSLYAFYSTAFNCRNTEIGAKLGLLQLNKMNNVQYKRNRNYILYNSLIQNEYWKPQTLNTDTICNLGYPVIHPNRDKIVEDLIKNDVEVRPLISGNIGGHPFWVEKYGHVTFKNVQMTTDYGCYVPNHPFLHIDDIKKVSEIINKHTK